MEKGTKGKLTVSYRLTFLEVIANRKMIAQPVVPAAKPLNSSFCIITPLRIN
jgi:hypothetical protein